MRTVENLLKGVLALVILFTLYLTPDLFTAEVRGYILLTISTLVATGIIVATLLIIMHNTFIKDIK